MKYFGSFLVAVVFAVGAFTLPAQAQTAPSIEDLIKIVNELTAQVTALQAQIKAVSESQSTFQAQVGDVLEMLSV